MLIYVIGKTSKLLNDKRYNRLEQKPYYGIIQYDLFKLLKQAKDIAQF